ncbi:MAG: T9SS type A sorting domain-containing protein [Chitinophagales bacterium]|nr:T9SS type A sorting domain-containing protein [Chitinophagales bacterium]
MKRLSVIFFITIFFVATNTEAQRYLTPQFTNVKVTKNVKYGTNLSYVTSFLTPEDLLMDVYEPDGDTATNRPVIILGHAGSFLNIFPWGNKEQYSVVELCNRFAKLGYVAISIGYRIGWAATSSDPETREKTIINAVYRAMQDFKTCVRYLRKTYEENQNPYRIDPCKIFVGGTNSGGYASLAVSNLNKQSELTGVKFLDSNGNPYVDQSKTGDFDGFGGTQNIDNHKGYNSMPSAVLALGAATGDTMWIEPGEIPVVAFHGVEETNTPYNTAIVITGSGTAIIVVSGSGDYMPRVERVGNNNIFKNAGLPQGPPNKNGAGQITQPVEGLYPFYGEKFEPWSWYDANQPVGDATLNPNASEAKAKRYIDTIMSYTAPRFKAIIDANIPCQLKTSVHENLSNTLSFSLLPNPASEWVTIMLSDFNEKIIEASIYNLNGTKVMSSKGDSYYLTLPVSQLSNGIYFVEAATSSTKKAFKVIVQH